MPSVLSTQRNPDHGDRIERMAQAEARQAVPIPFQKPEVKQEGNDKSSDKDEESDKSKWVEFTIKVDAEDKKDKNACQKKVHVFEDGTPEEWCILREEVERLQSLLNYETNAKKTLLSGSHMMAVPRSTGVSTQ